MRQRATRERRKDREEFIYRYRSEITELLKPGTPDSEVEAFVEKFARPELEYNPRTYWVDIWFAFKRDYQRLFNINIW
jgi:hypothetical protein